MMIRAPNEGGPRTTFFPFGLQVAASTGGLASRPQNFGEVGLPLLATLNGKIPFCLPDAF